MTQKKYLCMCKKTIFFVGLMLQASLIFSQRKSMVPPDSLQNVELPVAVIRANLQQSVSLHENAPNKLSKKTMQRLNQAQDLPYVLNSISSVVVSSDAGTGTG